MRLSWSKMTKWTRVQSLLSFLRTKSKHTRLSSQEHLGKEPLLVDSDRHCPLPLEFPANIHPPSQEGLNPDEEQGGTIRGTVFDVAGQRCYILLDIPVEILLLIFSSLPLPSQVCLSLTCKPLYSLFGNVLKDESLAWPRLLATRPYTIPLSGPDLPRNQLLLQLEDKHWPYCSGCLKIHPRTLFMPYIEQFRPSLRWCKHSQGVVALCPCLALTFPDRIRLGDWLCAGYVNDCSAHDIYQAFQLLWADGRQYLLHQCSMVDHADAFIKLVVKVTHDESNCMVVQTTYHIRSSVPLSLSLGLFRFYSRLRYGEPIFLCAHLDLLPYVRNPFLWGNKCGVCKANFEIMGCTDGGRHVVLQGVRNLGGIDARENDLWRRSSRDEWN